ncbi:MAG: PKD domain-containing protein [Desulforhopalus sp.]
MKINLLFLLLLVFITPSFSFGAEMTTLEIEFAFTAPDTPDKQVSGYRLYKDGTQVCETHEPGVSAIACNFPTEVGTFDFTLTACYADGTESPASAPCPHTVTSTTAPPPDTQGSKTITYSWENDGSATNIAGYRMYMNDSLLCQTNSPNATSLSCDADLVNNPMAFSVASFDSSDIESQRSNILELDPSNTPALFLAQKVTFNWDYVDNNENKGGFRLYNNGNLLCETTDFSARQLTCEAELSLAKNIFTMTAVGANGLETALSNALIHNNTNSGTPSDSGSLLAVINPTPASGKVPLKVTFAGTASTGDISAYTWDFGDGSTGTGAVANHTYSIPGTYNAKLIVKDTSGTSHQASTTITAQPGAASPEAPTAIISSSSAAGNAPLKVTFDGASSTTVNPPIVSYNWTFGDGSQTTGKTSSHTFTEVGTYYTELTVTDSKGLTDKVTTPIVVVGTTGTNKKPTAVISANVPQGDSLTVSFDGSKSSDPDGSIVQYNWNFGDGSTATGAVAQHTYTKADAYTVSLLVTDNQGGTAAATRTIDFNSASPAESLTFEVGEVSINHEWVRVLFDKTFNQPVVIAGPPTYNDNGQVTVRIRNIDQEGFEIRLQEWDYQDGAHIQETLSYVVIEEGTYTLPNGSKLEAGNFTGSTAFKQVSLQQAYSAAPVILAQVTTDNETDAVTTRIRNIAKDSFELKLQEMQETKNAHGTETVGYLAWEPGKGEISGLLYEVANTTKSVSHNWYGLSFNSTFADQPLFIAGMQTYAGGDPAVVRTKDMSQTSVQVKVEEEQSLDTEIAHATEVVGYLSIMTANVEETRLSTFTWEFDSSQVNSISGFSIYNNNKRVCETMNPDDRSITCETQISQLSNSFSIKAIETSGTETEASNILIYKP